MPDTSAFRPSAVLLSSILLLLLAPAPPVAAQDATPTPAPQETPAGEAEPGAPAEPEPDAATGPETDEEGDAAAAEDRPRDLESEIDDLREELERLRDEVAPADPGSVADENTRGENGLRPTDLARRAPGNVQLGGVATTAAVVPQNGIAQFVFPRMGLFLHAPVGDRITFNAELTVLGGGAEAIDADRGAPGRGAVYLPFAAADLVVVPDTLVVRGGIIAIPVGRTNLVADESARELLIRSPASLYTIPTPWFDVGGGGLGAFFLGNVRMEWQAYVVSGPSAGIDRFNGLRSVRQPPGLDRNGDKAFTGRLVARPVAGFEIGASGYSGAYSVKEGRRLSLGELDVAVDRGDFSVEAEGVYVLTGGGTSTLGLEIPERMFGASAQATWRFLPAAVTGAMPDVLQHSVIGATVRYSIVDTDLDDPDETVIASDALAFTRRDRLALGLSLRPVNGFVARAEYEFRREAGGNFVDDDVLVLSATAAF